MTNYRIIWVYPQLSSYLFITIVETYAIRFFKKAYAIRPYHWRRLSSLSLLCGLLFTTGIGIAQSRNEPISSNQKIETLVDAFLSHTNLPGLSLAISKNEQIVYAKGFGYADLESQQKMTPTTRLRTASVAKVITATALGRLLSEGKLDLDAPIKQYIPYIDPQYAMLTTRQLAGHTSGLPHRPKGIGYKKKQYSSTREMVELIKSPLLFGPDTDYKYSTNGFNLLAAVIEGASGKPYIEYMRSDIFEPLGMEHTIPENIKALTEKDAQLYYFKKDKLRKEKRLTNGSYKLAGAGFRSTPTDLVKMMHAYTNGFISVEAVSKMFQTHQLKNGEKTQVGIAWRTSIDIFGHTVIEHAGNWRGARTVLVHYPAEGLQISLMINASCPVFIEEMAHILAQVYRENKVSEGPITHLDASIAVTFRSNGKEEFFGGNISMDGKQGKLEVESNGFLKSTPIYYLGFGKQYVAITKYGLLYMNLSSEPIVSGNLYLYHTRNTSNPIEEAALVSFEEIP